MKYVRKIHEANGGAYWQGILSIEEVDGVAELQFLIVNCDMNPRLNQAGINRVTSYSDAVCIFCLMKQDVLAYEQDLHDEWQKHAAKSMNTERVEMQYHRGRMEEYRQSINAFRKFKIQNLDQN